VQGNGRAALHYAAGYGSILATEQLLQYGADVNVKDKAGMTPLHFAVQMGQRETVELLLKHRANPFLIVSRGIHKGRLAIDLIGSHHQELGKRLADSMSRRSVTRVISSRR
jgi:ankyrin repeat protein